MQSTVTMLALKINFLVQQIYNQALLKKKSLDFCRQIYNKKLPLWREASSLIIICPSHEVTHISVKDDFNKAENIANSDYNLLMVKRSHKSSFMANAFVFPGGIADVADFSSKWLSIFDRSGFSKNKLSLFSEKFRENKRPQMIEDPLTLKENSLSGKSNLLPDLGLRITAIRETFEETGILLLKDSDNRHSTNADTLKNQDMLTWQKKVHTDANYFIDLCDELKMSPDVWSLYEWSDWLTPTFLGSRRYDTMFYVCCLQNKPEILLDSGEVTSMLWSSPSSMMQLYNSGDVILHPPQVYELSRFLKITSYNQLAEFAKNRQFSGCECWMPVFAITEDGHVSYLPGDDLYPKDPDFEGTTRPLELLCTLEEHRSQSKNLHRMEIQGNKCNIYCNIVMPYNHLPPEMNLHD